MTDRNRIPAPQSASPIKGRGSATRLAGRFETLTREAASDEAVQSASDDDEPPSPRTVVHNETARSIISHNDSPDLRFAQSINPYRGCEHGCIYCYARPTHAYLNLSPGLDFETQLFAKRNAAERLRAELGRRGHRVSPINLGANTDPYQPIERHERITRAVLEVLTESQHPLTIVTKGALVCRDIDLLAPLAAKRLVTVFISIAQLDHDLTRILEPRASTPTRRLRAIRELSAAGIPTAVLVAPVIPFINDEYLERVLEASREAGAIAASYTILRLPHEVNALWKEWLGHHFPDRAERVMARIRDLRGGRDNVSEFGVRMKGQGIWAELIRQRFRTTCMRIGLGHSAQSLPPLDTSLFQPPPADPMQARLF
ncbi:MAG: PA0069 family radical SAM protein [Proteobacteria bacterium]|nr:PA0069 family radical SAM protein [Pseudomonadota bacterium]